MIVRIATEGQFRVGGATLGRINEIDARLLTALKENDGARFSSAMGELMAVVRGEGQPVAADELVESDLILPPPDASIEEARRLFGVDGLAA